jgi:hypothetical protein
MRIATWNVACPATDGKRVRLLEWIDRINADIWVLTNTDASLRPSARHAGVYTVSSNAEDGTGCSAIWSRYPLSAVEVSPDSAAAVAALVRLPSGGELIVYATDDTSARAEQRADWLRVQEQFPNAEFCVIGPLDLKRHAGAFADARLACVTQGYEDPVFAQTGGQATTVDHIVVSAPLAERDSSRGCWPAGSEPLQDLSKHFGIYVDFQ